MRPLHPSCLAAIAALTFAGCDCVGSDFDVKQGFSVHSSATDELCKADRIQVSLADNSTFTDLKAHVGKLTLKQITLNVTNPKTDESSKATAAHGTVRVADSAAGTGLTLGTWGDVPISAGSTKDIPFDAASAATLTKLALTPPNTFFLEAEGCNDQVPAAYDFEVVLRLFAEFKL